MKVRGLFKKIVIMMLDKRKMYGTILIWHILRLHLWLCSTFHEYRHFSYICDLNKSTRLHPLLHVGERIKDSHVDGGIFLYYLYLEAYFLPDSQGTV